MTDTAAIGMVLVYIMFLPIGAYAAYWAMRLMDKYLPEND